MEEMATNLRVEYDVIICGAGIAGLTLARQITQEIPGIALLVIEGTGDKARTGAIQVGESTVEASAHYLADVVGLRDYLEAAHFHKWGFRFFFGNGHVPLHERPEIGVSRRSPLNSYQLDRALFEADVKKLNKELGIAFMDDCKVEQMQLATNDDLHEIVVRQPTTGQKWTLQSRWVIDAMGRRRFIQRQLGIAKPHNPLYSASWFRMKGRIDICDMVPESETTWHAQVPDHNRYYSTNHLMENGRWVWLIPLASGQTSIGIVAREDFFPFTDYNTFDKALQWLHEHEPQLWEAIHTLQPVDFQCLRHYSYSASQIYSAQRWACTGDAATFSDPFFSPGIDQVGMGNTFITEMVKRDQTHQLDALTVQRFNNSFLAFHDGTALITQSTYPFYGDALVAGMKLLWDIMRGFSLNAVARFNNIYLDEHVMDTLQPILSRSFLLTLRMEKLFKDWAVSTHHSYHYQFTDYLSIPMMKELYQRNFRTVETTQELLANHQMIIEYLEEVVQIMFIIALADTMPEMLARLPEPIWLNAWGVGLNPKRWTADKLFSPTSLPRSLRLHEFTCLFEEDMLSTINAGRAITLEQLS